MTTARSRGASGILHSFNSLLIAQVIGAVLGFVFWATVARAMEPAPIGIAAAAIATQTLVGSVTSLGAGMLFISELPLLGVHARRRLIRLGLLIVTAVSLVIGLAFGWAGGSLGPSLRAALDTPAEDLVFAIGVAGAAVALVVDQGSLGLGKPNLQVMRNLLASGLRFPVVAVVLLDGHHDELGLQLAWVAPLWLSIVVTVVRMRLALPGAGPEPVPHDPPRRFRYFAVSAARNHLLTVALSAGTTLVPVIAAMTLGERENASFAIAWLIASFIFLPPYLLATALFAHGANSSAAEFRETMRETVPAALTLSALLVLGALVLERPVLWLFGGHYVDNSAILLALLAPAGLWMVIKDHIVAFWRAQRMFRLGVGMTMVSVVVELTGATIGAMVDGGVGLCLGWLVAQGVEILIYLPFLRRTFGGLRYHSPLHIVRNH